MKTYTTFTGITEKQWNDFLKLPLEGSFQMINLLKFKDKIEEEGITGEEGYAQYMKAALPFFKVTNAEVLYSGKPIYGLIGPKDRIEWDKILIVQYESKEEFIGMISHKAYPAEMRSRALLDSRLILCTDQ
ncbi:hypothetical protein [Aquimarina litoralis]|uniref:hypothetical protein n=1 Tax=Aquimarina litoralis TaxID=584605 RepID=UPI001C58E924|nr:hypothetical protein [Aquimarina litoralis]MBW1296541.1 hypothetical protein [Aquimarina litoralis]